MERRNLLKFSLVTGIGAMVLASALVGCAPASPIVGKWTANAEAQGQKMDMTVEYKADKTFENTTSVQGMQVKATGTYELKDNKTLTTTIKTMEMVGELPKEALPFKSQLEKALKEQEGKTNTLSVEFKDDTMVQKAEGGGQGVTLTKVKS